MVDGVLSLAAEDGLKLCSFEACDGVCIEDVAGECIGTFAGEITADRGNVTVRRAARARRSKAQ